MTTWNPIKLSAVHHRHVALGATMVDQGGWRRPSSYTTSQQEHDGLCSGVGLCDVSPAGKLYLQGADIDALFKAALPQAPILTEGQVARHTLSTGDEVARILLCRFAEDQLLVVTPPGKEQDVAEALNLPQESCVHLVDITSALTAIRVVGPRSRETLERLIDMDLSAEAFQNLRCAQASMALVHAMMVRIDFGDELGFELYVGRDLGEYIWDALMEAGRDLDITPFGLETLRRLLEGR